MELQVNRAVVADLAEAEVVMRGVLDDDLGGYRPQWHQDLDDLAGAYLGQAGRALFVARLDGRLVGTAGVRPCRLRTPPNPRWLAERYNVAGVCELVRVWVGGFARRRGVGRALVGTAAGWAVGEGGYRTVYLHTDATAPGAEGFWRALPTRQVHDARPDPHNAVHFELDATRLSLAAASR
jgi:GNAT superfamily N-acetyltransferase